jgi:hypothetical protein
MRVLTLTRRVSGKSNNALWGAGSRRWHACRNALEVGSSRVWPDNMVVVCCHTCGWPISENRQPASSRYTTTRAGSKRACCPFGGCGQRLINYLKRQGQVAQMAWCERARGDRRGTARGNLIVHAEFLILEVVLEWQTPTPKPVLHVRSDTP